MPLMKEELISIKESLEKELSKSGSLEKRESIAEELRSVKAKIDEIEIASNI